MSEMSNEANRELMVLRHLNNTGCRDHPGYKHVLRMLDEFHVDGPNGRHMCIVSDVVGPSVAYHPMKTTERPSGQLARSLSRQLLLAVDYLHKAGVVHGGKISGISCFEQSLIDPSWVDIHPGNVLFRLPNLDELDLTPGVVNECFGEPRLGTVTRCDGGERDPGVPEYLVMPAEFNEPDIESDEEDLESDVQDLESDEEDQDDIESYYDVYLIDLGECTESQSVVPLGEARQCIMFLKLTTCVAFFIDRCPSTYHAALMFRPPELVFGLPITKAVDVWSLGCAVKALFRIPLPTPPPLPVPPPLLQRDHS